MIQPIRLFGDPVLRRRAVEVVDFDKELRSLVADLQETMLDAPGVGLAAPQIGIPKRIAVIDVSTGEDPAQKLVLINPEIVSREGSQTSEEGCLSLPTFREPVTRPKKVVVRARDAKGAEFEMAGEDLLARAIEHETDHLHGRLYISHISPLKRDLIRRKIRKLQKANEWG